MNGNRRSNQKGFTLLASGICAVGLFGAAGLAVDIGRMYITKNEAQSYADAAAVSATMKLDGTAAGLAAADAAVAASTNKWGFSTTAFSGTVTEYSADSVTWNTSGATTASTARFARVTATVNNLPLYLLPVVGGFSSSVGFSSTVRASAVAGQILAPAIVIPFSPIAHAENCPGTGLPLLGVTCDATGNFGFTVGQRYDMKWPGGAAVGVVGLNKTPCSGDNDLLSINQTLNAPQGNLLGYVAFNSASSISTQIQDDVRPYNPPLAVGQTVDPGTGTMSSILKALNDRAAMDDQTDVTYANFASTFATYKNASDFNGRRIVTMIINSGFSTRSLLPISLGVADQSMGVGFGQFLLMPGGYTSGNGDAWCATYLGANPIHGTNSSGVGVNGAGEAFVRLTQ